MSVPPLVDGIPYARSGREELTTRVHELLAQGDVPTARVALLADADHWWGEAPPPDDQLAQVVHAGSLRGAMDLLGMGRVADYFAFRWSDPTYLAGLGLLQQHWPGARPVVEIACGTGHYLRELAARGCTDLTGVDVVWAKLWLAQRFVCPSASYVCADVGTLDLQAPDVVRTPAYVLCHDALYFLRDKPAAVQAMRRLAGSGGTVVVGHAHVADQMSSGQPLSAQEYADLLGTDLLYDDDELTRSLLEGRAPVPQPPGDLEASEAVALVAGDPLLPATADLGEPVGPLVANPLYDGGVLRWPSERYEQEYGPRSTYLPERWPDPLPADAARRRLLVDLPVSW